MSDKDKSQELFTLNAQIKFIKDAIFQKRESAGRLRFSITDIAASDKRITGTVLGYFDHISKQRISQFEAAYPKTVRALFDTAFNLIHGKFGEKLEEDARALSPTILNADHTLLKQTIEDMNQQKIDMQALIQIFRNFLDNLSNPSHLTVELLLQMNLVNEAIHAISEIKNEVEKSKSFEMLIEKLLKTGDIEKAQSYVNAITDKHEKEKALICIVDELLSMHKVNETLEYVDSRRDPKEIETMQGEIIHFLLDHGMVVLALEVVQKFDNQERKDYILSSMVKSLVSKQQFFTACEVIASITDPDFREDANSYLIKGLLDNHQFEDAMRYVESIKEPREKIRAAKVVLNSMLANHETDKVEEVCHKFELVK